jgi:hypothetical protein
MFVCLWPKTSITSEEIHRTLRGLTISQNPHIEGKAQTWTLIWTVTNRAALILDQYTIVIADYTICYIERIIQHGAFKQKAGKSGTDLSIVKTRHWYMANSFVHYYVLLPINSSVFWILKYTFLLFFFFKESKFLGKSLAIRMEFKF